MHSKVFRSARATALGLLLLPPSGCDLNQTGDLAAEKIGDVSNPARRGDPRAALAQACGGTPTDTVVASPLQRRPYLQQLTTHSVTLLWTAERTAPAASVVVSRADGTPVAEFQGVPDTGVALATDGVQWTTAVTGLAPDTAYCYEVRAGGLRWAGASFRTAPEAGTARPVRFVAFGDSGSGSADQRALLEQVVTVPFDLLVHVGDLAYDHGTRAQIEENVFGVYGKLFESFSFFPTSGNHEYDTERGAPFREAFDLPGNGGAAGRERWYSFDWGDVHFVALDTEVTGAEQASWLDADLTANRLPWTVVYLHRPAFSSGEHGGDPGVRHFFMPLFAKHRVPLVLAGHDHHYERMKLQNGVAYVVTGGGGKGTRSVGESPFTAFSEQVIHFVYVVVDGETLTIHAIDGRGTEFDSLVVRRARP